MAEDVGVLGVRFRNACDGLAGYDEQVDGSLGADVPKAEAEIILVDNVGWDFTVCYFLEKGFVWRAHLLR